LELKRRLSGETDCVTAPFRSAPTSPNDTALPDNLFSLPNRSFVIEEGMEDASSAFVARTARGAKPRVRLAVQIKAHKRKQKKLNASKIAFFYYRLFFVIGSFQWVTADSNKNFLPSPKLLCRASHARFQLVSFSFPMASSDNAGQSAANPMYSMIPDFRKEIASTAACPRQADACPPQLGKPHSGTPASFLRR
jgi:hypothetical protein